MCVLCVCMCRVPFFVLIFLLFVVIVTWTQCQLCLCRPPFLLCRHFDHYANLCNWDLFMRVHTCTHADAPHVQTLFESCITHVRMYAAWCCLFFLLLLVCVNVLAWNSYRSRSGCAFLVCFIITRVYAYYTCMLCTFVNMFENIRIHNPSHWSRCCVYMQWRTRRWN